MSKKLISTIIFFWVIISNGAYASDEQQARDFIDDIAQKSLAILRTEQNDTVIKQKFDDLFERSVDINWVSKFILGVKYRELKTAEYEMFRDVYRIYLINRYVPKFKAYNGHKYTIIDTKDLGSGYYKVVLDVYDQSRGSKIVIEYRVKLLNGKAIVRDITVEGISLILTQRSDITGFLKTNDINSLISKLKKES